MDNSNSQEMRDLELKMQSINLSWLRTRAGLMEREKRHHAIYLLRQKRREYAMEVRRKAVNRELADLQIQLDELRRRAHVLAAADL